MSTTELVRVDDKDGVRLLTFNRPEALNSMSTPLWDEFAAALTEAALRSDIAVVVITGEGRAFTAGTDLSEMGSPLKYDDGKPHGFEPAMDVVDSFPKPLIAAVNGLGVGIGLTILPHCDLVLMAENAKLRAPFVSLGVTAEAGSTYLLPQRVGWQETAHMLYTADWVDADTAVACGLAWRKVPLEDLMAETMTVARQIAAQPVASLVATKKLLTQARIGEVRAARAREVPVFSSLAGGPANREAVAAFIEKRAPDFSKLKS
jgi:enoyl-CoA hydratase/carnithine racemase